MENNFWNKLPKPFFVLAPMEDVTDIVFRKVIAKAAAPDVFFTEFTNSESFFNAKGKQALRGRIFFEPNEKPIVAHIWGDNPKHFRQMSIELAKMGFSGIDLNMGCPAPNVFKDGKGAGLILRPNVAADLIEAAKAGGLPVSVKTRLGIKDIEEYKLWLKHLLLQDIANLSIHLRSKDEMTNYPAHWELIGDIVKLRDKHAPNTLLTINGDIEDYKSGIELVNKYGFDGVMIGRGVFHNPFAFEKANKTHSPKDLIDLLRYHLDMFDKYTELEPTLSKQLHRFFKIDVCDIKGVKDLRIKLMDTKSTADVRNLLDDFENANII